MKVYFDATVDAIYIKPGNQKPDGVVELSEGVNLDKTAKDKIVGIEILIKRVEEDECQDDFIV